MKLEEIVEKYIKIAAEADVIFEINTGAMARGIRKTPYFGEELLYILKQKGSKLILSSDSHSVETLTFQFEETEKFLRDIGFDCVYELKQGKFQKRFI